MKRNQKAAAFLVLSVALSSALVPVPMWATVQVLPETILLMEEKKVTGQSWLLRHPVVTGLLAAFEHAESALKKEDIDALMQFYAPSYDYHGLKRTTCVEYGPKCSNTTKPWNHFIYFPISRSQG